MTIRAKMIRLAASMPKGSSERKALLDVLAAGKYDSAWDFQNQGGLYVSVTARNYRLEGGEVKFEGTANFSPTTGSEHRLFGTVKNVPFTAYYDVKGGHFGVKSSQGEFFGLALQAAFKEEKDLIVRDLVEEGIIPADMARRAAVREADFADRSEVDLALGHLTKAQRILQKLPAVDTSELDRLINELYRRLR
jgi:hypothetical protein